MNHDVQPYSSLLLSLPRPCLACGYDLRGSGEEPRCPECGLLNIPEGFRRQVWELVDSGKWLFSGPFQFFRKRPPGWWWALDREGDVRRSTLFAIRNIAVLFVSWSLAIWAADAIKVELTNHQYYSSSRYPELGTVDYYAYTRVFGIGGRLIEGRKDKEVTDLPRDFWQGVSPSRAINTRSYWAPSWDQFGMGLYASIWCVLIWGVPSWVGLCTQIRKGLPSFARAPRTILAAANYESHRLIYASLLFGSSLAMECVARIAWFATNLTAYGITLCLLVLVNLTFAWLGWIAPLRSDYTRQLVRGRFHAFRIILMYAIVLPFFVALTVAFLPHYFGFWLDMLSL